LCLLRHLIELVLGALEALARLLALLLSLLLLLLLALRRFRRAVLLRRRVLLQLVFRLVEPLLVFLALHLLRQLVDVLRELLGLVRGLFLLLRELLGLLLGRLRVL
jgi:hypothetical protein